MSKADVHSLDGLEVSATFTKRILARQAFVGTIAFFIVNLLAPWALLLEAPALSDMWLTGIQVGPGQPLIMCIIELSRLVFQRNKK